VTPFCPLCTTIGSDKPRAPTPYYTCSGCGLWWQSPAPPKLYQHPDEYDLAEMPEGDRQANKTLAQWLFDNPLGKRKGATLDIGSKHGVLSEYLATHGCEAVAMDAEPSPAPPDVRMLRADFEDDPSMGSNLVIGSFDLITCVHFFEHIYRPLAGMQKMRGLMRDENSRLFIRMPDSNVPGIERDFLPERYAIHPFIHSLSSLAETCARTKAFVIEYTYALEPGQRDSVLRPI
jgi:SAM-dependent methyltransferase